jgi:glycosyltransferase involved in cell wall biosynthesis
MITVILPIYNGTKYLKEAVQSILDQTYADFELIVIDDGSTDRSADIVGGFNDSRIYFYTQKNEGLAATLNRGISISRGTYIARQDQDDVSLPDRLLKQVAFLNAHQDYGMVGTWAVIWEEMKPTERFHKHSVDSISLKFDLLFDNAFVHSSLMIRRTVFSEAGIYSIDPNRQPPEDYELWSRVARKFRVANIPEVLHVYREMPRSMSRTGNNPFLQHLLKINVENLAWATEGYYSNQSLQDLAALIHGAYAHFSGETPWKELVSIVRQAANFLCHYESARHNALQDNVRFRLNNLRYHYNQARYFSFLGDSGRRALINILRVGRTLLQKTRR